MARFPRATQNEVPAEGTAAGIVYPPFHNMDIGARKGAGMPGKASEGPNGLVHVGGTSGSK